jgi:hypothetical protein
MRNLKQEFVAARIMVWLVLLVLVGLDYVHPNCPIHKERHSYEQLYQMVSEDLDRRLPKIGHYEAPFHYIGPCDEYTSTMSSAIQAALTNYVAKDAHRGLFIVEADPPQFYLYYHDFE